MPDIIKSRHVFPCPERAGDGGLLAFGGDLAPGTLVDAYSHGIFPWYSAGDPVLWWCPDPRCVLYTGSFHISSRSSRKIRNSGFSYSLDMDFAAVIRQCAAPRRAKESTWILPEIIDSYTVMHEAGYAHSLEIWQHDQLVGGLYGIALGKVFFGESMFRKVDEASRAALVCLVALMRERGFALLDCQQATPHMLAMGAIQISRSSFLKEIAMAVGSWPYAPGLLDNPDCWPDSVNGIMPHKLD